MPKCDCKEFCERSGIVTYKNGEIGQWFCPYIPVCFGGPGPECKMLDKDSGITTRRREPLNGQ